MLLAVDSLRGGLAEGNRIFVSIENGQKVFSPNTWQMMTFLNPLDALIPKIQFLFFLPNCGSRSPAGPGVSLGRILGGLSMEPFLYRPHPLGDESPPNPAQVIRDPAAVQIFPLVNGDPELGESNPQYVLVGATLPGYTTEGAENVRMTILEKWPHATWIRTKGLHQVSKALEQEFHMVSAKTRWFKLTEVAKDISEQNGSRTLVFALTRELAEQVMAALKKEGLWSLFGRLRVSDFPND